MLAQQLRRDAELARPSPRSRTRRSHRGRRRSIPAPTSVAPRRARRCTTPRSRASARARGTPRARAPRSAPPSGRTGSCPSGCDELPLELLRARLRARHRRTDPRGSRSRARRSSPRPRRRRRPPRRAPRRPPTRRRRRSGARAAPGGSARASRRRSGSVSSARGQSCCSSRGGPGQDDGDAAARLEHERRRRAGEPDDERALRAASPACGCPGSVLARRERRGDLDASSSSSSRELPPGRAREQLDRPVVVRRPEPARARRAGRARARRGAPPRARPATSPTIRTCAGSTPSESSDRARNGPLRSVRSPRTSSEPGDDDRAARRNGSGRVPVPAGGRHRQHPAAGARPTCTRLPADA